MQEIDETELTYLLDLVVVRAKANKPDDELCYIDNVL